MGACFYLTKMTQVRKRVRRGPGRPARSENRDTRGDILAAAEELFAVTGFEATSLRQIAGKAMVDLATVKYHFSEKSELYDQAYSLGHARFMERFAPLISAVADAEKREEIDEALRQIATACAHFIQSERSFVRLTLYRMLESDNGEQPTASLLQSSFLKQLTAGFDRAVASKLVRKFDASALLTFAVVGIPMWVVATEAPPQQADVANGAANGAANAQSQRVERFVGDLLSSMVLHRAC